MKATRGPLTKNQLISTDSLVFLGFAFLYPATSGFTHITAIVICFILIVMILAKSLIQHVQYYKLTHKIY